MVLVSLDICDSKIYIHKYQVKLEPRPRLNGFATPLGGAAHTLGTTALNEAVAVSSGCSQV